MKELVMTKYLEGLKELFDKHGVTQAYSYEPFANTKEDGVVMNKRVLFDILRDVGESVSLYLQLHYSIVFLLRKENIYE